MSTNGLRFGDRKKLPNKRSVARVKYQLHDVSWPLYVETGTFTDGGLAEVFLTGGTSNETFANGMLNCFALAISIGLQHGVPLETFVSAFKGQTFGPDGTFHRSGEEPSGETCTSVADLVFTELERRYLSEKSAAES